MKPRIACLLRLSPAVLLLTAACGSEVPRPGDPSLAPDAGPPDVELTLRLGGTSLTSYDFGTVAVAGQGAPLAITLINHGTESTRGLEIRVDGDGAASFDVSGDCDGVVLAPWASCSLRLHFRPTQPGARGARLVAVAAPGDATGLDLTGTGVAGPDVDAGAPTADAGADASVPAPDPCTQPAGTTITGNVRIRSSADLPALVGVGTITGDLVIDAPALQSLSFADLRVVGRDLAVQSTSKVLASVQFPALCSVGRHATFTSLGALASIGLPTLRTVAGDLDMVGTAVTSPGTTSSLRTIGGTLRLVDDAALVSLAGLDGVTSLGGLSIKASRLASLDGLRGPFSTGSLRLEANPELVSVASLAGLAAVRDGLVILANPKLASLDGLGGLITAGNLELRDNAGLVNASALARVELLGALNIANNDALRSLVLSSLAAVDNDLRINGNDTLVQLAADRLITVGKASVSTISQNRLLPGCHADRVRNRLTLSGSTGVTALDNGPCGIGPSWLKVAGGSAVVAHRAAAAAPDGSSAVAVDAVGGSSQAVFGQGEPNETWIGGVTGGQGVVARYRADGTLLVAEAVWQTGILDLASTDGAAFALYASGYLYKLTTQVDDGLFLGRWASAFAASPDGSIVAAGRTDCSGPTPCKNGFLKAYSPAGALQWSITLLQQSASLSFGAPSGVVRLNDGSVWVSGTFSGQAIFGAGTPNQRTLNATDVTAFIARYSTAGIFQGVETITQMQPRVVGSGNVAAICGIPGQNAVLSDGNRPAQTAPAGRLVVATYGVDGHIGWIRTANDAVSSEGCRLAATADGVTVGARAGYWGVVFESGTMAETRVGGVGYADGVVARFSASGALLGAIGIKEGSTSSSNTTYGPPAVAMSSDRAFAAMRFVNNVGVTPLTVPAPTSGHGLAIVRLDSISDPVP